LYVASDEERFLAALHGWKAMATLQRHQDIKIDLLNVRSPSLKSHDHIAASRIWLPGRLPIAFLHGWRPWHY
jgi:hypothetical protein